jgi:hypothetical protein
MNGGTWWISLAQWALWLVVMMAIMGWLGRTRRPP